MIHPATPYQRTTLPDERGSLPVLFRGHHTFIAESRRQKCDDPYFVLPDNAPREGIAEDGHLRSPPTRIDVRWVAWAKFDRKAVPKRTPSPSFFVMTTCGGHDETVSTPRKKYHLIVEIKY